ncbi:hypothetical protein EKL29_10800 [Pantoea sp. YU22]|uniref:hypothetical protein n=1 Tax=Pantoea TaxID=53335 RepID=UPI000F885F30|nr:MULTISPECIES: hypothetical protein [Pantoea]RTY57547.1 hypothetical protein EKL29_10800 [Pantoea sp. YU22]
MTEKILSIDIGVHSFKNSYLKDVKYFSGALELTFSLFDGGVKSDFLVTFEWIHSFRVTDEGDLLKMQDDLNGQMITGIYTVEGSHYLSWFNEQSANIHDEGSINHYLIVTGDDVIEVLSSVSPTIISC